MWSFLQLIKDQMLGGGKESKCIKVIILNLAKLGKNKVSFVRIVANICHATWANNEVKIMKTYFMVIKKCLPFEERCHFCYSHVINFSFIVL